MVRASISINKNNSGAGELTDMYRFEVRVRVRFRIMVSVSINDSNSGAGELEKSIQQPSNET